MALKDKVVLYVPDYRSPSPANSGQVLRAIRVAGPRAIVSLANLDSTAFAARVPPMRRSATDSTWAPAYRPTWR
jgi:hypothetical protein